MCSCNSVSVQNYTVLHKVLNVPPFCTYYYYISLLSLEIRGEKMNLSIYYIFAFSSSLSSTVPYNVHF